MVAVGFPCSQSQPKMLCADWQPHPFPKSHFPSCSSLSTSHPHPAPAGSLSSASIQALLSHKLHLLLMGEEVEKKRSDGKYSFCSLGDGKGGAGVIQPETVTLPMSQQEAPREGAGAPPRGWCGVTSPPAPQKKGHPFQTEPSLSVMLAMPLQMGAAPQQRAPTPCWTVPRGGGDRHQGMLHQLLQD